MSFSLDELAEIIHARRGAATEKSYTKSLFEAGVPRIAKKFGEEAVETVIAALGDDKSALTAKSPTCSIISLCCWRRARSRSPRC